MVMLKRNEKIHKKIYLDEFRKENGVIDWNRTLHEFIEFEYADIIDKLYVNKIEGQYMYLNYKDTIDFKILKGHLREVKLKTLIYPYLDIYKYKIGDRIITKKQDIIIIDRKIVKKSKQIKKYYRYRCNKCGFECGEHYRNGVYNDYIWIREDRLEDIYCNACSKFSKISVEGINDIPTTAPWMIKYFKGGYEEAKKYSKFSCVKIKPICPICKNQYREMTIDHLYESHGNICCNKSLRSYPERIIKSLLNNLNMLFIEEYVFGNNSSKRYDFYFKLNNEKYIIEIHGRQHYDGCFEKLGGKTLEEEQQNDLNKYNLAIQNGIKPENYIVIDCRKSELDFIKQNILHSKLNEVFDLNNVDWSKIEYEAVKMNLILKEVCDYWNDNEDVFPKEIAKIFNISSRTILEYLKQGNKIGLCNYDVDKEFKRQLSINNKNKKCKKVEIFKDGESLGIFDSTPILIEYFYNNYGIKFNGSKISNVCLGRRKTHKKHTFKYV